MTTKIIAAPTIEPITLTQAKNYLRVDLTTDDTFIEDCIGRARRTCELTTGIALYTQTLQSVIETDDVLYGRYSGARLVLPRILLPYSPVQSISNIYFESDANVWQETDITNFNVDYDDMPTSIMLQRGIRLDAYQTPNHTYRFKVKYIAGYDDISKISQNIMSAMYMYLSVFYTNRNNDPLECTANCLLLKEKIYLL